MALSFDLLQPRQLRAFVARETVGPIGRDTPAAAIRTPLERRTITVDGARTKTLTLEQNAFDVGVAVIANALVLPRPSRADVANTASEGPFLRYDGDHIILSLDGYTTPDLLFRSHGIPRRFSIDPGGRRIETENLPSARHRVEGEAVFLGDFHDHFGHVLVEGLNRLWFLSEQSPSALRNMRFLFQPTWADPGPPSQMWEILGSFGIARSQVIVADEPIRIDRLIVPSPAALPFIGWKLHFSQTMEASYADIAARLAPRSPAGLPRGRLYFARPTDARRRLRSAEFVEGRFRDAGYSVVHPETMSFADQVAMAGTADAIAGPAGSALHLAAFAASLTRLDVITTENLFLPGTDVALTLFKNRNQGGAAVRYFFGHSPEGSPDGFVADWDIDRSAFDAWFAGIPAASR